MKPRPISALPVTLKQIDKISFYNSSVSNYKTVNKMLKDMATMKDNDTTRAGSAVHPEYVQSQW